MVGILGWFKRPKIPSIPRVRFKSNAQAFQYAAEFMAVAVPSAISDGSNRPPIIGFVNGEAEQNDLISRLLKSNKKYDVSLALKGGVTRIRNCGSILLEDAQDSRAAGFSISDRAVRDPRAGDIVLVEVGHYDPSYSIDHVTNYFVIVNLLKPEIDATLASFIAELP